MKDKYNIVELFSGIGSQAKALTNIGINIELNNTCEWDIHAFIAYDAIHNSTKNLKEANTLSKEKLLERLSVYTLSNNGKESMHFKTLRTYSTDVLRRIYSALIRTKNLVDISSVSGNQISGDIDILTYSFPCQDLSNVGAFHGYNKGIDPDSGSRSSLLWQVGRILTEMKENGKSLPRYLVMENVPTLLSERHIGNFNKWQEILKGLGYMSKAIPLNAKDFGIPQNRPRLLMLSIYVGENEHKKILIENYFNKLNSDKIINDYHHSEYYHNITIKDLLRLPVNKNGKYWNEALECTPNNTVSRQKIWDENPKIIDEHNNLTKELFIRTITTKQDRNPNSGNIYFDTGIEGRAHFRYLTPRECLLFMGFTDKDYENIVRNNPEQRVHSKLFPRDKIIRMAGNSIPVKLLEGFFYQLYEIEEMLDD